MSMISRWFQTAERGHDQTRPRRLIRGALKVAALFAALGVAGFLVVVTGIIPIKASSGHWPITHWFLQFAKERSVATHALAVEAPPLDEPWLKRKGATHYEVGCRQCHGSPEVREPRIPRQMTPHPPYLPDTASQWKPEELFYMVKHGIKFTGMPAWPARQRDDEVWAMVAFLRIFPELDAQEYRQLASSEAASRGEAELRRELGRDTLPSAVSTGCGRCHGGAGFEEVTAAFPKLSGQRTAYLAASLEAYASGERHSGIMEPIAADLSSAQIRALAGYYGGLARSPPARAAQETPPEIVRGRAIALRGIPKQDVPACAACHGPSDKPPNPRYPALAGQHADYLVLQLTLFQQEQRGGMAYAHLMRQAAAGLSAEQINDVARYYASLTSTPALPEP